MPRHKTAAALALAVLASGPALPDAARAADGNFGRPAGAGFVERGEWKRGDDIKRERAKRYTASLTSLPRLGEVSVDG